MTLALQGIINNNNNKHLIFLVYSWRMRLRVASKVLRPVLKPLRKVKTCIAFCAFLISFPSNVLERNFNRLFFCPPSLACSIRSTLKQIWSLCKSCIIKMDSLRNTRPGTNTDAQTDIFHRTITHKTTLIND